MKFSNVIAPENLNLESLKHTYDGKNFDVLGSVNTPDVFVREVQIIITPDQSCVKERTMILYHGQ